MRTGGFLWFLHLKPVEQKTSISALMENHRGLVSYSHHADRGDTENELSGTTSQLYTLAGECMTNHMQDFPSFFCTESFQMSGYNKMENRHMFCAV